MISPPDISQLKNYIITTLSHEFRTPLSIIQGYTDLIINNKEPLNQDNLKELLGKIKKSSERINQLVEDFLLLVNLENDEFIQKIHNILNENKEIVGELYKRYTKFVFLISMKYLKNEDESQDSVMQISGSLPEIVPKMYGYEADKYHYPV